MCIKKNEIKKKEVEVADQLVQLLCMHTYFRFVVYTLGIPPYG